jgi:hypothetical protein
VLLAEPLDTLDTNMESKTSEAGPGYTILRIKRKRNEESLDALGELRFERHDGRALNLDLLCSH